MTPNKYLRNFMLHAGFTGLILLSLICAQDPLWPTSASRVLSSNFGEFRSDHFHMGLDIKSNGNTHAPVFATFDGYVSRLVTGWTGFGQAIYFTRPSDSLTVVYAHLSEFNPELNELVALQRDENQSYILDLEFEPEEYEYHRGDILGYLGNTGYSFGHHLHFEVRDQDDNALNPFLHGFSLPDHRKPIFKNISFFPLSSTTQINASVLPQTFPLFRHRSGVYELPDTVHCWGTFGLAVQVEDRSEQAPNRYQIYQINLLVDGQLEFSVAYDQLSYDHPREVDLARDYSIYRHSGDNYQRLFIPELYPAIDILSGDATGQLRLLPGFHRLEIQAVDVAGNKAVIQGIIRVAPPKYFTVRLAASQPATVTFEVLYSDTLDPIKSITCYPFKPAGYPESPVQTTILSRSDTSLFIALNRADFSGRSLQFMGRTSSGARVGPAHWIPNANFGDLLTVDVKLSMARGATDYIVQVETGAPLDVQASLRLATATDYLPIDLNRIRPNTWLSDNLPFRLFTDVRYMDVIMSDQQERVVRFDKRFTLVQPTANTNVFSADGNCSVRILSETLYEPTVVWIDKVDVHAPVPSGEIVSSVYQLQPFDTPLSQPLKVGLRIPETWVGKSHLAIYYYNPDDESWSYCPTLQQPQPDILISTVPRMDAVTLLQDSQAPRVTATFPANGARYQYQDVRTLRATLTDDLSGLDPTEQSLQMTIDGTRVWCAWQPNRKELTYRLRTPLPAGEHAWRIRCTDKSGNVAEKVVKFFVD